MSNEIVTGDGPEVKPQDADQEIDFLAEASKYLIRPEDVKPAPGSPDYLLELGEHDEGNAQCIHRFHKGKFAHNDALGWVAHTGTHWTQDGAEAILDRAVVATLEARIGAAVNSGKANKYKDLIKKCVPSSGAVNGAKTLLSSLCYASVNQFDNAPDSLNCLNGVVDLRTGKLTPHSTEQKFMHCTAAEYDPQADQSVWKAWLVATVGKESADWLQLAAGYSATGHTREEVLFYLYGPPRSGKGTFVETLKELLGNPLAKEVNFATFTAQRDGDSQNFDLAPLKPCRFVAASESNAYERFNEAKVKAITGGNDIYCAFKHKSHFGYRPQFKIWLSSNQPVNADPDDDAVWGRVRVIEFPNSNLGREDKSLKQQMKTSEVLRGVLAWIVEGAMKWYALGSTGLPELESGKAAKNKQRGDLDNVKAWLEEYCMVGGDGFVAGSILYLSYEKWCRDNGVEPKKQKGFTQSLDRKGFAQKRTTTPDRKTVRGFAGIGLA